MSKTKDLVHLHFIVIILGITAILGKLISLSAESIVFWRLIFAVLGLSVYIIFKGKSWVLPIKQVFAFLGIGVVVAVHWLTFFAAIKLSNVSVTLVCLSSSTLFTSLFEPLFLKKRISALQFILGLAIIGGIYLIFRFEATYSLGIVVALISAILASLFTVLNKKVSVGYDATLVSVYELAGGLVILILYSLLFSQGRMLQELPVFQDFIWLFLLGVLCTSYAYTASVKVMRSLSAYLIVLTINMEPIYGILLGVILFGDSEFMTSGFYAGAILILATVFLYPVLLRWQKSEKTAHISEP